MKALRALAPAKVNLGLFLGPVREGDGRHELVSVMQSISLADELTLERAAPGSDADEVLCPAIAGPPEENLAARALAAFRMRTRWEAPPLRLAIDKRIPVAAGLGGGSADAAAALRLAHAASGLGDRELLLAIAGELGADVPAQVAPGRWLARGAGERLAALPDPATPLGVLVLPLAAELSTAAVYAEADRLAPTPSEARLDGLAAELARALDAGQTLPDRPELLANDLLAAALSLCPAIADALAQARAVGAEHALLSGSGPTVLALFAATGEDGASPARRAAAAAAAIAGRAPAAIAAESVGASHAMARPLD